MRIDFLSRQARLAAPLVVAAALAFVSGATAEAGSPTVTAVSAGGDYTCLLSSDTTVWCWGWDAVGQLGDGSIGGSSDVQLTPVQVQHGGGAMSGVKAISAGLDHTCALLTSGQVWCWGQDSSGELGDGTTGGTHHFLSLPVQVRKGTGHLDKVTAISAGRDHTCALRTDQTIWCWGSDYYGELGDGTTGGASLRRLQPVHVLNGAGNGTLGNIKAISAGARQTCALRTDGTIRCWGFDRRGELGDGTAGGANHLRTLPVEVKKGGGFLSSATAVSTDGYHTCAIVSQQSVWCWGHAGDGEVGDGTRGDANHNRLLPVQVVNSGGALTDATAVSANFFHTCARRSDQTAWCWGDAASGDLGDGTAGDANGRRTKAVEVVNGNGTLTGISKITSGAQHSCALATGGVLWCWGVDAHGQLGDGTTGGTDGKVLKAVRVQLPF